MLVFYFSPAFVHQSTNSDHNSELPEKTENQTDQSAPNHVNTAAAAPDQADSTPAANSEATDKPDGTTDSQVTLVKPENSQPIAPLSIPDNFFNIMGSSFVNMVEHLEDGINTKDFTASAVELTKLFGEMFVWKTVTCFILFT